MNVIARRHVVPNGPFFHPISADDQAAIDKWVSIMEAKGYTVTWDDEKDVRSYSAQKEIS